MISSLWIKNGIIEGYWDKTSSGRFYTWNKEINNTRLTFAGLSWCLLTWIVLRIWLFRLLSCLNLKTKNKQITQNLLPLEIDHHLLIQIQMFYRNRSPNSEEDKTNHTFIFWTSDGNCEIKIAKLSRIVFASLIAFSLNKLQCVCTMILYYFK